MSDAKIENVEKKSIEKIEIEKAEAKLRSFERNTVDGKENGVVKLKDLEPNKQYEKNGYTYQTDNLARPVRVSGYLRLERGVRTSQQSEIGRLGKPDDEGGHIIGTQFDGPADAYNIRPQDKSLNHIEYNKLETEWVNAIKTNKTVRVEIEPRYNDSSIRPDRYIIKYWIDGIQTTVRLKNQAIQS